MDEKIEQYILNIIFSTREPARFGLPQIAPLISYGASPRASIALAQAARAMAFINRRGFVTPDDVKSIANDVLRHRIGLTYEAEAEGITADYVISELLARVAVP
jgi:MoxR-like ATPase